MYLQLQKSLLVTTIMIAVALTCLGIDSSSLPREIKFSFNVSMENPGTHYFHVELACTGQKVDFIDFKMPVWTPGYYAVQNNSKNVVNFIATNGHGASLYFSKTLKNTWRVDSKNQSTVVISYEVYAPDLSVVGSFLDASKAFICPTSLFMFPAGQIEQPSLITFKLHKNWKNISTGLDLVDDKPNTFFASDFDVLFDCPVLMGNQQVISFTVNGIPHSLAVSEKDTLGKTRFISDLTKIIETATSLIGDIPYSHYTFITIGSFGGGMEHANSCALSCTDPVADTSNMDSYKEWLSFVTHEYFHLFNVKRIRPIALGPFDYDHECYTNMLWVSEGFTVYYEYLILNRAGIFTRNDCYKYLAESITGFENRPGHLMEPVTYSSFDAWIHYFSPNSDARNNTISYYDKGCALGLLLDLKIRSASEGKMSLDNVMRELYNKFYKELKRGFTDEEFKMICEKMAGTSLDEIFTYANTVNPIDYPKYLALAGLTIDTTSHNIEDNVYFGASVRSDEKECRLYNVERNSPAWNAGLGNDIEVVTIDGQKADREVFESVLKTRKAGDTLQLSIKIDEKPIAVQVVLTPKVKRSFQIEEIENIDLHQKVTKESWLK
jgi:predicted metalloprotease with PDZ domain